jgi:hypothetical protein
VLNDYLRWELQEIERVLRDRRAGIMPESLPPAAPEPEASNPASAPEDSGPVESAPVESATGS